MNKIIIVGALAGVVVVGAGAATMTLTDPVLDDAVERLSSSLSDSMTLDIVNDQSTFTDRQLDFSISVDGGADTLELLVSNVVTKRPWGSSIEHEVFVKEMSFAGMDFNSAQLLREYLVNNAFITGQSNISVLGQFDSELNTVAIAETIDDVTLDIAPLTIRSNGSVTGSVSASGEWPGFDVSVNDFENVAVALKPVSFELDGRMQKGAIFVGSQSVEGEGLSLSSASASTNQQLDVQPFSVSVSGEIDGDDYASRLELATDGFTLQDNGESLTITEVDAAVSLQGLNATNYQNLVTELNTMQTVGVPSQALMDELNSVLKNGFRFEVERWKATIEGQSLNAAAHFQLPENQLANVNNPMSLFGLIGYLDIAANLEMDAGLAEVPQVYDGVFALLMTGALVNNGDQYTMAFEMKDGLPMLNGQPMPLPF